jgi:hypothetical protein
MTISDTIRNKETKNQSPVALICLCSLNIMQTYLSQINDTTKKNKIGKMAINSMLFNACKKVKNS